MTNSDRMISNDSIMKSNRLIKTTKSSMCSSSKDLLQLSMSLSMTDSSMKMVDNDKSIHLGSQHDQSCYNRQSGNHGGKWTESETTILESFLPETVDLMYEATNEIISSPELQEKALKGKAHH